MKLTLAAAGALLLGTSAVAWAAAGDDPYDMAWKDAGVKSSAQLKAAVNDALADAKAEPAVAPAAWADETFKAEPAAWAEEDWKVQPAATSWMEDDAKPTADVDLAAADKAADMDEPGGDLAMKEESAVKETGVGGPIEDEATAADLTPRPATHNYPACDPGPGDDNCIQLYEPGVRTALASWNAPTGGLAGNEAATAMGGPYEPVDDSGLETADADVQETALPATATAYAEAPAEPMSDDLYAETGDVEPGVSGLY